MAQLAQINIARMREPLDHPVMRDFVANLDAVNALAEASPGFVWRLKDDGNNATEIKIFNDDFLIVNMSVWKNVQALSDFVYKSGHTPIMKRRAEWFEKMAERYMALWYVPDGHEPTVSEAEDRLNHIRTHGDTQFAFSFRKLFQPG